MDCASMSTSTPATQAVALMKMVSNCVGQTLTGKNWCVLDGFSKGGTGVELAWLEGKGMTEDMEAAAR